MCLYLLYLQHITIKISHLNNIVVNNLSYILFKFKNGKMKLTSVDFVKIDIGYGED